MSSSPHSNTPVGDVLSEAQVSMEAEDVDPDETLVKIVSIAKKEPNPNSKKRKDPQ